MAALPGTLQYMALRLQKLTPSSIRQMAKLPFYTYSTLAALHALPCPVRPALPKVLSRASRLWCADGCKGWNLHIKGGIGAVWPACQDARNRPGRISSHAGCMHAQ